MCPLPLHLVSLRLAGLFLFYGFNTGDEFDAQRWFYTDVVFAQFGTPFEFVHNYPLSMIPLFIGLGHVAYRAGFTTDLFAALKICLARLPGGLAMASIVGCGGFSAVTGSSVACASAMGRIAVPEMLRHNVIIQDLATGAVAMGGTLGSLIPPSILFVIYAIFTEQSVKLLFLAGILPGDTLADRVPADNSDPGQSKTGTCPANRISFLTGREKLLSLIQDMAPRACCLLL